MIISVLRPESTFRTAWDLITMICTLYSLIYVPVYTFFDHEDVRNPRMHYHVKFIR